jgi:hypothetical protein
VTSRIVITGRQALAELLRLIAKHVEGGATMAPPAIYPAPHYGDHAVTVGGAVYDLADGPPAISHDPADDQADPDADTDRG